MFYANIMSTYSPSVSHIREQWENDMGVSLSDEEWEMALTRVHSSSICSRHALIQFKVLHRLHFSKAKLARIFPNKSPICDKCKQTTATLYHMFWSCSKLDNFWSSFFDTMSQIYGVDIQPSPLIAILGIIPESDQGSFPAYLQRAFAFSSLLARRLILFKWKDTTPPIHNHWIRDMMQSLKLEKIRGTLNGSLQSFQKTWDPFIRYVDSLPGLDI